MNHGWILPRITAVLLLLAVGVGVGGCQQSALSPPALTDKDNGKIVKVCVGDTVTVSLASNPTTGFSWQVVGSPAPLALRSSAFASDAQANESAGAGGTQILAFAAKEAGAATIALGYRRPWEKVAPARTFTATVVVVQCPKIQ